MVAWYMIVSSSEKETAMRNKVRRYMLDNFEDNTDDVTGEIDCTFLAEDAAMHFDLYDANGDIPEWIFELAFDVSEELENTL